MDPRGATTAAEKTQYATPPLPNEILTEILARLPTKSIGSFRAVSREWCAMLSSPSFVGLHARLANSLSRRQPRLLLTPARSSSYDGYVYSWRPGGPAEKLMRDDLRLGCPIPITKPCRGLILIRCTNKDDGPKKIIFGTGTLKVFAVDPESEDAPEILFTPDGTIIGSCDDDFYLTLGLFEEHLGSVGRTIEEMVFSSLTTNAWSDVLKWMSARSVSESSLVCRVWRAMIMTNRFIQSHVIHANLNKSPRVMIILDASYGMCVDLKDFPGPLSPSPLRNGIIHGRGSH